MKLPRLWNYLTVLIVLFLVALPLIVHSPRYFSLIDVLLLNIVLALGVYSFWTVGYLNAAQPVFFGLGAYTVAILTIKVHWPFWLIFPIAGIIPAIMAVILGLIALKIRGASFMFITIAFCELMIWLFDAWKGLFGGVGGLYPVPQPLIKIFGLRIDFSASMIPYYYLALILVVITCLVYFKIHGSLLGRVWQSVGKNADLLANTGISVFSQKLICLVVSCFFAGLAGAIYAPFMTIASPGEVSLWQGIWIVLGVLLGGIYSPIGAIIGTVFVAILNVLLEGYASIQPLILGLILTLVLLFMPSGILGFSKKLIAKLKDATTKKVAQPESKKTF